MLRRWETGVFAFLWLALSIGFLYGCAAKPVQVMAPQTRLIYGDEKGGVWTWCDRGNRVYMGGKGQFQVIQYGCPDGTP
jgi:hypothetical protein